MDVKSPQGFLDKVKMLPMLAEMGKFFPKTVSTGPCKEVIKRDNFSLLDFPILQCWPKDAGRFITLPCVGHARPQDRQAQRRHVPHAGVRRAHHRHALAAPESGRRTLPRSPAHSGPERCGRERPGSCQRRGRYHGAYFRRLRSGRRRSPRRQNGSRGGHRHRSRHHFFRDRSRSARCRGISDRRLPPPEAGRTGEVRNG